MGRGYVAGRRTLGRVRWEEGQTLHTLFSEKLTYDADDEVTRVVWDHVQHGGRPEAQSYGFDQLGRLTTFAQGDWDGTQVNPTTTYHDWSLDELANWRRHHDGSTTALDPTVDPNNNAYNAWPTDANQDGTPEQRERTYDDVLKFLWRSETPTGAVVQYVHDGLGRLVRVERATGGTPTVLVKFGYDASGRLAWKQATGQSRVWFVWDGAQTLQEIVGGAVQKEYVWAGSRLVRTADAYGATDHLHQDRLGSIVLATRKNGDAVEMTGHTAYDAYGRPSPPATWGANQLPVPYGFAGARWEAWDSDGDGTVQAGEGLYLMGARWYDPEMGRFIEQDPIGEAGGLNLYAYVGSSPTQWVDPTGLRSSGTGGPLGALTRGYNPTAPSGNIQWYISGVKVSAGWGEYASNHLESGFDFSRDSGDAGKALKGKGDANDQGKEGTAPGDNVIGAILDGSSAAITAILNTPGPISNADKTGDESELVCKERDFIDPYMIGQHDPLAPLPPEERQGNAELVMESNAVYQGLDEMSRRTDRGWSHNEYVLLALKNLDTGNVGFAGGTGRSGLVDKEVMERVLNDAVTLVMQGYTLVADMHYEDTRQRTPPSSWADFPGLATAERRCADLESGAAHNVPGFILRQGGDVTLYNDLGKFQTGWTTMHDVGLW